MERWLDSGYYFLSILLFTGFVWQNANAQSHPVSIDSLMMELENQKTIDSTAFISISYYLKTNVRSATDTVILYGRRAEEAMPADVSPRKKSEFFNTMGIAHFYSNDYDKSLSYFLQSLEIRQAHKLRAEISNSLNSIGNFYFGTKQYEDCEEYYIEALSIAENENYTKGIIATSTNLGSYFTVKENYKRALTYFNKAYQVTEQSGDSAKMTTLLNNMAILYRKQQQYPEALEYDFYALEIAKILKQKWDIAYINNSIGESYMELRQYNKAYEYLQNALATSRETGARDILLYSYKMLTKYHAAKNNYAEFEMFFNLYENTKDSIFDAERQKTIADFQVRYQTQQKEKENAVQKLVIGKQRNLNTFLIIISGFILLLVILIYIRYRNKQKLNQQLERKVAERTTSLREEIKERKSLERKILSTTIETEERERKRFSEDLHDGLGPLLSAIKMYTDLIKNKAGKAEEQKHLIDITNELLDEAILSTKEIANNLTPNVLNDFGLLEALNAFGEKINQTKAANIRISASDKLHRLDTGTEVALYRIIAELINNTLKHAHAKNIDIALKMESNKLNIDYKDDGIGLDIDKAMNGKLKGLGITNIISRIKSFDGSYRFYERQSGGFHIQIIVEA